MCVHKQREEQRGREEGRGKNLKYTPGGTKSNMRSDLSTPGS